MNKIDWNMVREVLRVAHDSMGIDYYDTPDESQLCKRAMEAYPPDHADWSTYDASYIYAIGDDFVMKSKLMSGEVRMIGLTSRGYDLFMVLDNDEIMSKIIDLATENNVSLTADIIIEAGRHLSLKKMGLE